jgi:hypothetical protein
VVRAAGKGLIPQHSTNPQRSTEPKGHVGTNDERWCAMIYTIAPVGFTGRARRRHCLVMLEERPGPADDVHSPSRRAAHANSACPNQEPLTLASPRNEADGSRFAGRVRRTTEFDTDSESADDGQSRLNEPSTRGCVSRKPHSRPEIAGRERHRRPDKCAWPQTVISRQRLRARYLRPQQPAHT